MSTPPARCCAPATSGRCNNAPAPYGQSRYIGCVEIAACNHPKHQAALRSLPDFRCRAGVCGADDCGKPDESGLCPEHRQLYRRHGINIRALLAQEAPMTEPTPLSKLPELGFARIQVETSGASLADLEAAVARATDATPTPPAAPQEAADGGAIPSPAVDAVEPSEGDVADAPLFVGGTDSAPELVARWGQVHTAPVQPTAPGPTLAEVQAQLERERERADRAELDAVAERARADEALEELATIAAMLDPEDAPAYDSDDQPIPLPVRVQTALMPDTAYERELRKSLHAVEAELFAVDRALQHLGAYGNGPTVDRLLKVLTPEDRRNILELQAAEARLDLARLKASRLNPPPPEKLAEYAAKVAEVEARIAALDAGDVRG